MKKIVEVIVLGIMISLLTGCLKRDNFEDVNIYTTVYPIEYITEKLYGEHSEIFSIYPNGVDIDEYKLTDKQKQDYSKTNLFIFNGLSDERNYVSDFFKFNKKLKIIDTTTSMEINYKTEELWLDPSNFLMLAQNIRYGLKQYINNHYLKNEIDENFEQLKEDVSRLDADMYDISSNTTNSIIVASSDLFKYLEKYNIEVISLEENENLTEKTIARVIDLIDNQKIHCIFMKQGEKQNDTIKKIVDETSVDVVYFHSLSNLTGEERNAKKDYLTIMNDNIELLRNELYD